MVVVVVDKHVALGFCFGFSLGITIGMGVAYKMGLTRRRNPRNRGGPIKYRCSG